MRRWFGVVTLMSIVLLASMLCGAPDFVPSLPTGPVPTPSPSTIPGNTGLTKGPLKIDAHRFRDRDNNKVYLFGAVICCASKENPSSSKPDGWPLVNNDAMLEMRNAGANYTHIRLGPNGPHGPDNLHQAYGHIAGKANLLEFNQALFDRIRSLLSYARSIGMYVEISLIDGWVLKHEELKISPWLMTENANGVAAGTCQDFDYPVQWFHQAWIRKVVQETGDFDNVLYLDGNEVFDCRNTNLRPWVESVKAVIRDEETKMGYKHHPFGTNSHDPSLRYLGYEVWHVEHALPSMGRPLIVNEYRSLTAEEFKEQALAARHVESSFMLWRGRMREAEWQRALGYMKEIRNSTGF